MKIDHKYVKLYFLLGFGLVRTCIFFGAHLPCPLSGNRNFSKSRTQCPLEKTAIFPQFFRNFSAISAIFPQFLGGSSATPPLPSFLMEWHVSDACQKSPASAPSAVTVGSIGKTDARSGFSTQTTARESWRKSPSPTFHLTSFTPPCLTTGLV